MDITLTPCCQCSQNLQNTIRPLSTPIPQAQSMPCSRTSLGVTSTPDQTSEVKPDARQVQGGDRKNHISNSTVSFSIIN
jgi:hypothetical protein